VSEAHFFVAVGCWMSFKVRQPVQQLLISRHTRAAQCGSRCFTCGTGIEYQTSNGCLECGLVQCFVSRGWRAFPVLVTGFCHFSFRAAGWIGGRLFQCWLTGSWPPRLQQAASESVVSILFVPDLKSIPQLG
jgi:hypothetical protein